MGVCVHVRDKRDLTDLMAGDLIDSPTPVPQAWQSKTKGNPVEEMPIFLQSACYPPLQGHQLGANCGPAESYTFTDWRHFQRELLISGHPCLSSLPIPISSLKSYWK